MTHQSDPKPGDVGYTALRETILSGLRADRDRFRRLDQQMARSDAAIAALVEREKAAAREQSDAVPVADPPDDPPAGEPAGEPAAETIPPPASLDELAAASALGSPAHMEWRRQHSSPDRGLFT